jgi:hypothetical protein
MSFGPGEIVKLCSRIYISSYQKMTESIPFKTEKTGNLDIAFYTLITLLSLTVLAGYIFIAYRSFFFQDDFIFLDPLVFKKLILPKMNEVYEFRPLSRDLFFRAFYRLFGLESFGFFMVNIIAHTLSAICLFFLLTRLKLSHKLSALVAFVYFSSVAAFEKVTWISNFQHTSYQLFLLLSALFAVSSLDTHAFRKILALSLSVLSWACALLSNMAGIFFPVILMLLLAIRFQQDNHEGRRKLSALLEITSAHWLVLLIYCIFILIPNWRQPNVGDPYFMDISTRTFLRNLHYYLSQVLLPNAGLVLPLIILVVLYAFLFVPRGIKKLFTEKKLLLNFTAVMLISGLAYAPFAFLKYQVYPNYVSLALIPWYVMMLFPFFSVDMLSRTFSPYKKIVIVLSVCLLTVSFLPNKQQLITYFENSPKLHIYSVWKQTESILPEIPKGISKVVFVDEETFKRHREVAMWRRPPFWWYVGHGSMFRILYDRQDIEFDYSSREMKTPEPDTLYINVNGGPAYYSLSLIPPVQNSALP